MLLFDLLFLFHCYCLDSLLLFHCYCYCFMLLLSLLLLLQTYNIVSIVTMLLVREFSDALIFYCLGRAPETPGNKVQTRYITSQMV